MHIDDESIAAASMSIGTTTRCWPCLIVPGTVFFLTWHGSHIHPETHKFLVAGCGWSLTSSVTPLLLPLGRSPQRGGHKTPGHRCHLLLLVLTPSGTCSFSELEHVNKYSWVDSEIRLVNSVSKREFCCLLGNNVVRLFSLFWVVTNSFVACLWVYCDTVVFSTLSLANLLWFFLWKSTIWALLIFLHSRTFPKKQVFPNELPSWKRIHKGTFPPKNKITYVFPNELPNWKRILKGKNGKNGKRKLAYFIAGGFIIVNRELAYFIAGGFINAMWTLIAQNLHMDTSAQRVASNLKFLAKVGCHNSVDAPMYRFAGNQVSSWLTWKETQLKSTMTHLNGPTMQYGIDGTWSRNQGTHWSNYGLIPSLP